MTDQGWAAVLPQWFAAFAELPRRVAAADLSRFVPDPAGDHRQAAVLVLLGEAGHGPDVLLTQRAATMRKHAGQVSFPGGALDPGETAEQAALREAAEETGLQVAGVHPVGVLPALYLPVSDFAVTPVLAWWRAPSPVAPVDPAEVAAVARVPLAALADPANRFRVRHPSGYVGPGFEAGGLFVWGFTAGLLDRLLHLAGWEQPWDPERYRSLPEDDGDRGWAGEP